MALRFNVQLTLDPSGYVAGAKRAGAAGQQLGSATGKVSADLSRLKAALAGLGLLRFGHEAQQVATQFETAFTRINTLVGVSRDVTERWKSEVRAIGRETGRGPVELAQALYNVTSAGLDGAEALDVLEASAKAAAIGLGETGQIAKAVGAAVQAYGKENLSAADAVDVLVGIVKTGAAEADEVANTLGRVVGIAAQVGVSFQEAGAFIATFTRLGVNADEAVTSLRGVLSSLLGPTKQQQEALATVGMTMADLRKEITSKGLTVALVELVEKFKGNEDALSAVIPNVRALAGVLGTAASQGDSFVQVVKDIEAGIGNITDAAFDLNKADPGFVFEQFKAVLQDTLLTIGLGLLPGLVELARALQELADSGHAKQIGEGLGRALKLVAENLDNLILAMKVWLGLQVAQVVIGWVGAIQKLALAAGTAQAAFGPLVLVLTGLAIVAHDAIGRWRRDSEEGIASIIAANNRARESIRRLREEMERGILTRSTFEATVNESARLGLAIQGVEDRLKSLNQEWAKRTKDGGFDAQGKYKSQKQLKDAIAATEAELGNLRSELSVVDNALKKAEKSGLELAEGLDEVGDAAGDTDPPLGELTDNLKKALAAIDATVQSNKALAAALADSHESYEILNALLQAGVPLADALTGAYDDLGRQLLDTEKAIEDLSAAIDAQPIDPPVLVGWHGWIQRIAAEAERASRIFANIPTEPSGGFMPGLPGVAGSAAEQLAHYKRVFGEIEAEHEETVESMASIAETLMDQAWRNIQDIAADAIVDIFDDYIKTGNKAIDAVLQTFLKMLAQLFVAWAANAAKRAALERGVAAAGGSGISVGGGGGGGGGWFSGAAKWLGANWLAVVGTTALVAAAGIIAYKAIQRNRGNRFIPAGTVDVEGGEASASFTDLGAQQAALDSVRQFIDAFEAATGGIIESMGRLKFEIKEQGDQVRLTIDGLGTLLFGSIEEALNNGLLRALTNAQFSGLSEAWDPFIDALRRSAFRSMEEIEEVAAIFRELENSSLDPVTRQIREMRGEWDRMREKLEEFGISAAILRDKMSVDWQSIRDSITGVVKSERQLFEERMKAFNREIEADRAKHEAAMAAAQAEAAAQQAALENLRLQLSITAAGTSLYAQINRQILIAVGALDAANAAAQAAQAALDSLPDPIKPGEFRGSGGGAGSSRASDLKQLGDLLDRLATERLPTAQRAMAEFAREWEGYRALAHGNAEALARLNAEMELQRQILVDQLVDDVYSGIRDFERNPDQSAFREGVRSIQQEADRLAKDFLDLAEALGFGSERIATALGRIEAAEKRRIQSLAEGEALDLQRTLLEFLGRSEEAERLSFELTKAELQIRYEELKIAARRHKLEIDALAAIGVLVDQVAGVDFEAWKILQRGPSGGGGGRGSNPADEMAEALRRLREIQARQLSPVEQAIRGVVDEFAYLRSVLGWTAEVQAAYGEEIRRVLMEQLEPIKRLQEELAFRSGSSMRSIDQFRLAQDQLRAAQAALEGGDLSQLDRIPELVRRVLELNPAAQASEGNRFVEAWVNSILDAAQEAAESVATGIDPGGANDPFAWLRTQSTAGDQEVTRAVYYVADRQDRATEAIAEETRAAEERARRQSEREASLEERRERQEAQRMAQVVNRLGIANDISREIRNLLREPDSITRKGVA